MPDSIRAMQKQLGRLLQADESQLLEQLGMRWAVIIRDLQKSADPQLAVVASDVAAMGIKDDMKVLGRRILKRWERSAYEIACGSDQEDANTRADLQNALHISDVAATTALMTTLIGVGLMPALAPLVAAIIVKKFFSPAYAEFCGYWKEKLPQ